ncbi:MAG: hypothetical protein KatS3mg059_0694 [Thermomicrobiales bacterium]|nr:MAG: hypothetical protein KatS3mg059_0694 [Thermomicrobiales bacterium]
MMRIPALLAFLFALVAPLLGPAPASATAVYRSRDAQDAMQMAYYLSVLEANGQFNALYDLIHPDAHAIIPRAAVVGWYQNEFAPRGASPALITGVRFVVWTWPVTGVTYPYTAEVSFVQEFWDGGAQTVLQDVVRLVQDRYGTWRWFFGRSREFVQEQIDRYVNQTPRGGLVDTAVADIGAFWATIFDNAGLPYREPRVVTFAVYVSTACGEISGSPAAYCPRNRTIYIDLDWQEPVMQIGDFAWITILAHEWGHHVQAQLSRARIATSFGDGSDQSIELQADCLAGVYAQDADTRGVLDVGDLTEAVIIAALSGDSSHGTGDDRLSAFMLGYLTGLYGCGVTI